jgi:4-hydroxy-4-methyl-2-oxoglutarate aldolase
MIVSDSLVERLRRVDTTSLSDADKGLRVLPPTIRPIVPGPRMVGRAVTAQANQDLRSVLAALELSGPGDVLVVADCGDTHAVAGELFATEAIRRGLAGIVIDGLCRDTATLGRLTIPVYARGRTPRAAPARAVPVIQQTVVVGGVDVTPGDLLVGDDDGIIVGSERELEAAIGLAEKIQRDEAVLRVSIEEGASLFDQESFSGLFKA